MDQDNQVHVHIIFTFNYITPQPPAPIGVHNVNEGNFNESGLDIFIQIQHDGDEHSQDDNIKYSPPGNLLKESLILWDNCKYGHTSLLPKYFLFPKQLFTNSVSM